MYKRILVPLDGSDTATRGLTEALKLAVDQQAQLRLLHVISAAYVNAALLGGTHPDLLPRIRAEAEAILQAALNRAKSAGVVAEPQVLEYDSAQIGGAILEEAQRWHADLIVMGTHGRRGLSRVVLGSDAEYVIHHTSIPVLLLRV
jgi:nucleotide-binding universal stress UspA family protein